MRAPSDLAELYTYWRLALESWPRAEAWRVANDARLIQWPDLPSAIHLGWYRLESNSQHHKWQHLKGKMIPVVIWLEQPIGEDGELLDAETIKIKVGHGKPMDERTAEHHEVSLWMTWEKCRRFPVSTEAYDYAMAAYALRSAYEWADDAPPPPPKPAPVDLRRARSVF